METKLIRFGKCTKNWGKKFRRGGGRTNPALQEDIVCPNKGGMPNSLGFKGVYAYVAFPPSPSRPVSFHATTP